MLPDNGRRDPKVMATALRQLPQQAPPSQAVIPGLLDGLPNVAKLVARSFEMPVRGPQVVSTDAESESDSTVYEQPDGQHPVGVPLVRG
jgi:hypothetical protein